MKKERRRRIWELGCVSINAILWTSFDWEDLLTLDRIFVDAKNDRAQHPHGEQTFDHLIFTLAHRMCHCENPTSRKIQRRLEVLHANALKQFKGYALTADAHGCLGHACAETEEIPELLWALLTDPRENVNKYGLYIVEGVARRAVKVWLEDTVHP